MVQQRNIAGMSKIKPQLDDLGGRLKEAIQGDKVELASKLQNQMNDLMTKNNVRPLRTLTVAV